MLARDDEAQSYFTYSPVLGFRNTVPLLRIVVKSNIWLMELAMPS
jgi:hypothetical protein